MRGIRLALAGFVLILAGCSSPAEPETLEPLPTTPSDSLATPAQTLAVPSPQSEANGAKLSAGDFVSSFITQSNKALSTETELAAWREMFADSCQICVSGFETTQAIHDADQRIQGGGWVDWSIETQEEAGSQAVVVVTGTIEAATVTDASGQVTDTFESAPNLSVVYSLKEEPNGDWLIVAGSLL